MVSSPMWTLLLQGPVRIHQFPITVFDLYQPTFSHGCSASSFPLPAVSGIVGAGGNSGAVGFGLGFRQLGYEKGFLIMGCTILASCFLSLCVFIKGHAGLITGQDDPIPAKEPETLEIPERLTDEDGKGSGSLEGSTEKDLPIEEYDA